MATITSNLRLTKIDVDDYISPIVINENIEKIDEAFGNISIDYVVAQGVQGDWIYRRWASGLAECCIPVLVIQGHGDGGLQNRIGYNTVLIFYMQHIRLSLHPFQKNSHLRNCLLEIVGLIEEPGKLRQDHPIIGLHHREIVRKLHVNILFNFML